MVHVLGEEFFRRLLGVQRTKAESPINILSTTRVPSIPHSKQYSDYSCESDNNAMINLVRCVTIF